MSQITSLGGYRVLLVEPDEMVRLIAFESLVEHGADVHCSSDLSQALSKLREGLQYDCVLASIGRYGCSTAFEYAATLRAAFPAGLIVMMDSDMTSGEIRSLKHVHSCSKPYRLNQLEKLLKLLQKVALEQE